ncbi:hypothetical protein AX17_004314 [Amanita inopinata Kibby_2008]|nr:hypothetical protein AX17_004314 [Amanita inopinata Kibby_2008]
MGDRYMRNALAQIQERHAATAAGASHRRAPSGAEPDANTTGRMVQSVPEPASFKPTDTDLFTLNEYGERVPNASYLKQHFFREGRLTEEQALYIIERTTEMLAKEPNLVHVSSPVTICGDIHGQYYDLMKLFDVGGTFDENNYLFLGDYVDRGNFGIECLLYLYALKLCHPSRIVLLRGNHECRHLTEYFTFKRECLHKYSARVYDACIASFCALPIAAVVDGRFFCVHGGLSPELITLNDLNHLNRFQEPGSHGLLCDLLWSDPIPTYGHEHEHSPHGPPVPPGTTFLPNTQRGCSYTFTYDAACQFLERNALLGVIRGHEAQDAGYTMHRKTPTKKFPSVITIFSAPNYLDVYRNRGAVLKYANKNITIRQYNYSSHPYWLPNFMDAFTWSLPFVGAKITEMLLAILSICSEEELLGPDTETDGRIMPGPTEAELKRRQQIKSKIMAVGRMQRVFQLLREESENASELLISPEDVRSMRGSQVDALKVQGSQISRSVRSFDVARRMDMQNERLPQFNPEGFSHTMFPAPSMSMRFAQQNGVSTEQQGAFNMESLIKKTLEEDDDSSDVVERIAERIAQGRSLTGRPAALKRYDTT